MATKGHYITASSFNEIQSALDYITLNWALPVQGTHICKKGDFIRASILNNYISWLKYYAGRVGATSETNHLTHVTAGSSKIYASYIEEIKRRAYNVASHCNMRECNGYECNIGECNYGESNSSESNGYESDRSREGDRSRERH